VHVELTTLLSSADRFATRSSFRRDTGHVRLDDIADPSVPRGTDYASPFVSDVPVVVQHTRLDSRRAKIALMTTVAYGEG
jgi:hypothetical protein